MDNGQRDKGPSGASCPTAANTIFTPAHRLTFSVSRSVVQKRKRNIIYVAILMPEITTLVYHLRFHSFISPRPGRPFHITRPAGWGGGLIRPRSPGDWPLGHLETHIERPQLCLARQCASNYVLICCTK